MTRRGSDRASRLGLINQKKAAMPKDVKAIVSALSLIVAAVLTYWGGSPVRPEFSTYIMVTAVFMVLAMWIFPEAEAKKRDARD